MEAHGVIGRVARPIRKPTDVVVGPELTTMSLAGICSTTELPVHSGQVGPLLKITLIREIIRRLNLTKFSEFLQSSQN